MKTKSEDLDYLLSWVISDKVEIEFYNEATKLINKELKSADIQHEFPSDPALPSITGDSCLKAIRNRISYANSFWTQNSLEYIMATTSMDRAKLMLVGKSTLVTKLWELRQSFIKDVPELELLFSKRLYE